LNSPSTIEFYQLRIDEFDRVIQSKSRRSTLISRIRLLTFLIALIWTWYWWNQVLILGIGLIVLLGLFFLLVTLSSSIESELNLLLHLSDINKDEIKILSGHYQHRKTGAAYLSAYDPKVNGMTQDLDVFGAGSLYQYIQRTRSVQGSDQFAQSLVHPYTNGQILQRQEAIRELSPMIEWRQRLMAIQTDKPVIHETQKTLHDWIIDPAFVSLSTKWNWIAVVFPCITITITLIYAFDRIQGNVYVLFGLIVFGLLGFLASMANHWFKPLQRIKSELDTLLPCIQTIENQSFQSLWTIAHKSKIILPTKASDSIAALNKIINRFDYRLNPIVFIPLNFFLCWDLQQVIALNRWKQRFKGNIDLWFECLAEIESLSSYANTAFNHPEWTYPVIADSWFTFESKSLAHPLLSPEKAVTNDFTLNDPNRMALITGSNMAGKSTFLRSIGANIVLAGAGAPVHAQYFKISPGMVLTSMRISDNLQEETSTFYAELKKIKIIVDAVNEKQNAIILIDEMLRGTNTEDRRIGSHGLVKQLIDHHAVGVIASHDTTLSSFKDQYPSIVQTYYFDSILQGDEIKFDYKLKPGVVTSANASYLMKKMGIEI
jgi:MutS domain V